jgi:hypothetical protein
VISHHAIPHSENHSALLRCKYKTAEPNQQRHPNPIAPEDSFCAMHIEGLKRNNDIGHWTTESQTSLGRPPKVLLAEK